MKNTYRIEKEDGIPHTVFFVKKPTKKDKEAFIKKEGLVLEQSLDGPGTIWKVRRTEEQALKEAKAKKAVKGPIQAFTEERVVTEKVGNGPARVVGGTSTLTRPTFVPSPTAAKERRVNVSLTVEWFKELSARGAALGLLPGQYARMLLVQSLNEKAQED